VAEKSIIIIGAGLAGLSAGCYGQMNGYQTRILEHHSEPGGVATGVMDRPTTNAEHIKLTLQRLKDKAEAL